MTSGRGIDQRMHLRRLVLAAMFAAIATVLGPFSVPVGYTRVAPLQATVNAIAGIFVGPWYAAGAALVTATLRYNLHWGTVFAFPGSPFGALAVGYAYRLWRNDAAALCEPVGTGLFGAWVAWLVFQPLVPASHHALGWFMAAFLSSSIPGAAIGYAAVRMLRRVPAFGPGALPS
jgi:energy coupling factor transporter S component ThiW